MLTESEFMYKFFHTKKLDDEKHWICEYIIGSKRYGGDDARHLFGNIPLAEPLDNF